MKVNVLEKASNELKIEIEKEGHTFCNVLHKVLLEDETVEMGGYNVPHPLFPRSIVYLRTKGRRPKTVLKDAAKKIRKRSKKLRKEFQRALRDGQKTQIEALPKS